MLRYGLRAYLVKKDQSEFVDDQSKEALNFQITLAIAWIASGILTLVLIGFVIMIALGIIQIVFPILGTIAANNGTLYRYPFALRLIK